MRPSPRSAPPYPSPTKEPRRAAVPRPSSSAPSPDAPGAPPQRPPQRPTRSSRAPPASPSSHPRPSSVVMPPWVSIYPPSSPTPSPFSLLSGHGRQVEWSSLRSRTRARGHAGEPPAMAGRRPCTRMARVDGGPDQWVPPGSLPAPYPFLPPSGSLTGGPRPSA
jgi:hypothetical protein